MKAWMLITLVVTGPVFAKEAKSLSFKEIVEVKRVVAKPVKKTKLLSLYRPITNEAEGNFRRPAIEE